MEQIKEHYSGSSGSLFAKYAVPQMVGLLFNSVYFIVDGVFIGNRLGRGAMAAAAVAVPFLEILIALAMAVASGAGIIISGKLSVSKQKEARQSFSLSIIMLLAVSAVIVIFGNVFIDSLAKLLGSTPEIHEEATTYLRYIITFSPFQLLSFLLGGLARNDGKPKLAMFALAFGSISNIVLDYVFMYPLNMGIGGAALATSMGPIFSVLILLPHFLLKKGDLYFAKFSANAKNIKQILTLGFPSFIMEFTIGIITFVYNFAIVKNGYGELGLAAYLMIGYLMLIMLTIFLGMAEGLQPVFSYFRGSGEKGRNHALLSFSAKIFLSIGVLGYILIVFFSKNFFTLFSPKDIELVGFASEKSLLYFSAFFLAGLNILLISFWQSTMETKKALAVSLLRSIALPPALIWALPIIFGSSAIWFCHSLAEIFTFAFAFAVMLRAIKNNEPPKTLPQANN